jgi:hypothetical protein
MLAVLYPGNRSFAAPVLYTHAPDGMIFTLPDELSVQAVLGANSERARLAMLVSSLQASMDFEEDWTLADRAKLEEWRQMLRQAERSYRQHLADWRAEVRKAAGQGLALIQARLETLEAALAQASA